MARKKKSRREYGSGTITVNRKIGRYTVRWYDDKGDVHSCSRFALTDDGLAAAEEFLERANKAKQHPLSTLGDWIVEMIKAKRTQTRESSHRSRKYAASLLPEPLVDKPIVMIRPVDITHLYQQLLSEGRAVTTIKAVHSVLRCTYQLALDNGAVNENIMAVIKRPRRTQTTKQTQQNDNGQIIPWRDLGRLMLYLRRRKWQQHQDWYLFFRFLYVIGCRVGELQALRWTDIDWEHQEVHIQRTVSGQDVEIIELPKTPAGDRFTPILSSKMVKLLREAYDKAENKSGYVFSARGSGLPVRYATLYRPWCQSKIKAKIHWLRRTRASHLLAMGLPVASVSRAIGHAHSGVTLGVYTHATPHYASELLRIYNNKIK